LEERPDRNTGEVKLTKVPYQPNGALAEVDNPATFSPFKAVMKAYQSGGFSGIGFVLTKDDDIVGFDIDHVRDPQTGAIEEWAQNIVNRVDSYTDITPSDAGLRMFVRGKLPPKDRRIGRFECYDSARYMTVTGNLLPGTPDTVENRQEAIDAVHAEMFSEWNKPRTNGKISTPLALPNLDDKELLDRAFNARNGEAVYRLYHGDISKYGSHSEADLALCGTWLSTPGLILRR
jgi:primase-polymerase (primpol)-like protein